MEDFANTEHLAKVCRVLVNKRHGIITALAEEPENPNARGLFVFLGKTIEASYFRENRHAGVQDARNGSGASFDRAAALWATLGESLERYAGFIYDRSRFILASYDEVALHALPLCDYILFSDAQYAQKNFPFHKPEAHLQRNWMLARDLSDCNSATLVPASMVYLSMQLSSPWENIAQNVSTGLSCSDNLDRAILGALCEVIERDAFSAMWQLSYAPPKIQLAPATANGLHPKVLSALGNPHTQIHLWSIATDTGIPVIMAMAENRHENLLAFGSCANPVLENAINKAAVEALHGLVWSHRIRARGDTLPTAQQIVSPSDHFSHYLEPRNRCKLEFLFSNPKSVNSVTLQQRPPMNRKQIVEHLKQLGYRTLAIEITPSDVASLGLHVLRVIVPGLHPLLFGHNMISRDERRLQKIARFWGISPFPPPNLSPHPFP